jgi:D-isomer specific 2-hydroxyacid dehydrogenase, NAD binding domain
MPRDSGTYKETRRRSPRANAAIDLSAARKLDITVRGTGYVSEPTVEHTWVLILAAARNLLIEADSMSSGGWQVTVGIGLHGKTLGVLGLVRVGSLVARIGQAFGMTTIAWSQKLTPQKAAERVQAVTKEQLFAQSDVRGRLLRPTVGRTRRRRPNHEAGIEPETVQSAVAVSVMCGGLLLGRVARWRCVRVGVDVGAVGLHLSVPTERVQLSGWGDSLC